MDDVSGLADKSNDFANFLRVSWKFGYTYLYIFHVLYSTRSIWQLILSQTKVFNIFPSAIKLCNTLKILANNCIGDTINFISARDFWINRLYLSLSNESTYSCFTIDCRKSSPAKYRTKQTTTLYNLVIMHKVKRIGFLINFCLKRSIKIKIH